MLKPDFTLKFIKNAGELKYLSTLLVTIPAFAIDIETTEWWNRHQERIALVQIAFRQEGRLKAVIIDPLADFVLEPLRQPLEDPTVTKAIHNAGFDAARLKNHYNLTLNPIFDTMLAARRSGEKIFAQGAVRKASRAPARQIGQDKRLESPPARQPAAFIRCARSGRNSAAL